MTQTSTGNTDAVKDAEEMAPSGEELLAATRELPPEGQKIMDKVLAMMLRHTAELNALQQQLADANLQIEALEMRLRASEMGDNE